MGRAKAAGSKRPKDENKPKRSVSAYFYYLSHCREEAKKTGKSVSKIGEFTKECSVKWNALSASEKKTFNEKAAADKKRYDTEMCAYKGTAPKDETKPKRPQTAYFLFLADYRKKMKNTDMPNKELITTAGKVWGEMTQKEKKPYQDKNLEEIKKFEGEMKVWKAGGGGTTASAPKKAKVTEEANGVSEEDEDEEEEEDDDEEEDDEEEDDE